MRGENSPANVREKKNDTEAGDEKEIFSSRRQELTSLL
jgi:hypothetical protein